MGTGQLNARVPDDIAEAARAAAADAGMNLGENPVRLIARRQKIAVGR